MKQRPPHSRRPARRRAARQNMTWYQRQPRRDPDRRFRVADDFKRAPLNALAAAWDGFMIDDWEPVITHVEDRLAKIERLLYGDSR